MVWFCPEFHVESRYLALFLVYDTWGSDIRRYSTVGNSRVYCTPLRNSNTYTCIRLMCDDGTVREPVQENRTYVFVLYTLFPRFFLSRHATQTDYIYTYISLLWTFISFHFSYFRSTNSLSRCFFIALSIQTCIRNLTFVKHRKLKGLCMNEG